MTAADWPGYSDIVAALQRGDVPAVFDLLERELSLASAPPRLYRLHLMRARLLAATGDVEGSLSDFAVALRASGSPAERGAALLGRGEFAESAGLIEQARFDLVEALAILDDPLDIATARQALGRIERDHGDLALAIELLRGVRDALLQEDQEHDRVAEATLDLAMALRLAGDTRASINLLEELIPDVDPAFAARILVQIGTTYGFEGQAQQALEAYGRALALLPDAGERAIVRYNRAVVLRDHGAIDDARDELERALVENAGQNRRVEFDALLLAGIVAREQEQYQRSLDFLREAAELVPEGDEHGRARLEVGTTLAATGLFGPAIDEFGIAIALCIDDTDRARALRYRGMARQELGLTDGAITDIDAAIALTLDPDERARGQATLATLLVATGRARQAIAALTAALDATEGPDLTRQLHVQRGSVSAESGNLDAAVDDFQRACVLAADAGDDDLQARVLTDLGAIHIARDEHAQAIAAFERALALVSSGPVAHLALMNLGTLHVSRGEPVDAAKAFERAAAAAEDDRDGRARAFLARGNASVRWGRYGDAKLEFQRVLTLQPSAELVEQAATGMRMTEHQLEHIERTRQELTTIIAAMDQPSYRAQPMLQRGMLALAVGDDEAALQDVLRATQLFRLRTEQALALGHLALVHATLGNCEEAQSAIAAARERDPGGAWIDQLAGDVNWRRCRYLPDFPIELLTQSIE